MIPFVILGDIIYGKLDVHKFVKDMIVNEISLVIQNIISFFQETASVKINPKE